MLKYLVIFSVIIYIFYKVGSFLFRIGAAAQQLRDMQNQQQRQTQAGKAEKKKAKVNGGEYIDYEEVK